MYPCYILRYPIVIVVIVARFRPYRQLTGRIDALVLLLVRGCE